MEQRPTIDRLLNQAAESPGPVATQLRAFPDLASAQDAHGYSLIHAASSWGHSDLLKQLVREFNVDINLRDEDGETCLFNAETVDMAKEIVNLGVDVAARNHDDQTAAEKLADEDEQPLVAVYLREVASNASADGAASILAQTGGANASLSAGQPLGNAVDGGLDRPPPLPNGVQINVGTMQPSDAGDAPDPEFRRRIEELAARQDYEGEDAQRELRRLISDAVSGVTQGDESNPASRRRLG
nr:ankyrin repeat-containing protein p1e11.10 [Quercus suber]